MLGDSENPVFMTRMTTREAPDSSHEAILNCLHGAVQELKAEHGINLLLASDEDSESLSFAEWVGPHSQLTIGLYDDFMAAVRYVKVQSQRPDVGAVAAEVVARHSAVIGRAEAIREARQSGLDPVALMRVAFSTGAAFDAEVFELISDALAEAAPAVRSMASYAAAHLKWLPLLPRLTQALNAEANFEVSALVSTAIEVIESSREDRATDGSSLD